LFALGVSFFSWFQTEQRSKAAEERTLKAERETHAALVVFHIEAVGDPQVSKTVLGGFMVVANFGHFPIEDVAIEEPGTVEIGGKDERIVTSIPIGTLGPCERATIPERLAAGYAVFTDINGMTRSRKPGSPPVSGHLADGTPVLEQHRPQLEAIKNCSR
jgi:hypothetical protein